MLKKILVTVIGSAIAMCACVSAFAAEYEIEAYNNVGKKDVVIVRGVEPKSTVVVYNDKNVKLAKKTASGDSTEVSLNLTLPNAEGGEITVSILEKGANEAQTISADYPAKPVADVIPVSDVEIYNNVDKKSQVYISGLESKDAIYIYNEAGKKLGSGKVGNGKDEITVNCKQLTKEAGKLFISVKRTGMLESPRGEYPYAAQEMSEITSDNTIEITNNVSKKGTFVMDGLDTGTVVTVYSEKNKKLGSAKCGANKEEVTINVSLNKDGGTVKVTLKEANKLVSDEMTVDYESQPQTPAPGAGDIDITANPTGIKDEVYLEGLEGGDIVKIYKDKTSSSTVLKGTVGSNSDGMITMTKSSLGTGKLWVSITRKGMLESERTEVAVPEVEVSEPVSVGTMTLNGYETLNGDVIITNGAGMSGSVYVKGLNEGSVITVYKKEKGSSKLGSATVPSGGNSVTVSVSQLAKDGGTFWISRKNSGENESERVEVSYFGQTQTVFAGSDIEVVNNSGIAGTITVDGISSSDVLKVYSSETSSSPIASGTCGNSESVTISTTKLAAKGGTIYISLSTPGYLESERVEVKYGAENASDPILTSQVSVINNTGMASSVTVTGLDAGDVISVYSSKTSSSAMGAGTVSANYSSVTFNVSSLKDVGGEFYVTRKTSGYAESERVEIKYGSVEQSEPVGQNDVTILNKSGAQGAITVTGLNTGDTVKIYKNDTISSTIGSGTASSDGCVTVNVPQLGADEGSLFFTVTTPGKTESARVEIEYAPQSKAPEKGNISVSNFVDIDSEVTVTGLTSGDEVRVYSSSSATTPIGMATVTGDTVTVFVGQLTASAGKVYVSVTNWGCCESSRTAQDYLAQQVTNAPTNVKITNNKNDRATVEIKGLESNDRIYVYSDMSGTTLLGNATANGSELTFTINSLGDSAGTVYISRVSLGKKASEKTAFLYTAAY